MPEEWGYHRNGNDRFLPATTYRNELDDLNIIESRMAACRSGSTSWRPGKMWIR